MCRGITSLGSPAPHRRNVAVPSGTVRLLHNRVKLQQRWHRARILTRFPAFIFPFLPPPWLPCGEYAVTSLLAHSESCQIVFFSVCHGDGTQSPSLPLRLFEKTSQRRSGKVMSSVTSPPAAPYFGLRSPAWHAERGLEGNTRMKKGGLQKQYGPAEMFSSVSFMTSCVSAESQRSGDQTAFTAFRRLNSTLAHVLRADRASALTEPFEGGALNGSRGGEMFQTRVHLSGHDPRRSLSRFLGVAAGETCDLPRF